MKWKGRRKSKNIYIVRRKDGSSPLSGHGHLAKSFDINKPKGGPKTVKVKSFKRKGKVVKAHTRKIK